jgi:crotonobetainyl-CoA:carnitine CoA-transferase CaiB-like acyl-CoA transferase
MSKQKKHLEMLQRLTDALAEDVLSATDEEILQEAAEDYNDPVKEIRDAREIFEKARSTVAEARLKVTQETARREKQHSRKLLSLNSSVARHKLQPSSRAKLDAETEFALAAQKIQDLSDADVLGTLKNLHKPDVKPKDDAE